MSAYQWKNYGFNFEKFKLDFKGHFGKNSKSYQYITKMYSVGFNHDAGFDDDANHDV